MYRCTNCSYSTTRQYDLRRHERRKKPCTTNVMTDQDEELRGQNISREGQNISRERQNISREGQNISREGQNISHNSRRIINSCYCDKCKKYLSCKKSFDRHVQRCKGYPSKTCPRCHRTFTTYQAHWKHIRHNKCDLKPLVNRCL